VRKFPDLARKLFDAFSGIDEITQWPGELLQESVKKNSSHYSGDKFFRQLCSSNDFLNDYEFPKKPTKKDVRTKLLKEFEEKDNLFIELVEMYFEENDIVEMGWKWWRSSIGKDLFWAGQIEIALFSHFFNMQLVIVKYKERPVGKKMQQEIEFNFSFPLLLMIEDTSIDNVHFSRTDKMSDTVFLWVVDPTNPADPIDPLGEGKHYISLNRSSVDPKKPPSENILHMEHDVSSQLDFVTRWIV
jgi:hypothetical protein